MEELMRCPFCGGADACVERMKLNAPKPYRAKCNCYGASSGWASGREEAVALWSKRRGGGSGERRREGGVEMKEMARAKERHIRIDRVVEITGFSRSYIYKLTHWKKMPFYKPTNGRLFFYESEALDFLDRIRRAADYEVAEQADAILNGERK